MKLHHNVLSQDLLNNIYQELDHKTKEQCWFNNWYDWCVENWGTKWNCNTVEFEEDGDRLYYEFDTAWSPPEGIYWKLKELFPTVHISWFYREDGVEMAGYIDSQF